MRIAEQVTFGGGGIDRAAVLRGKDAELAQLVQSPAACIVPLWRLKPMVRGDDALQLAALAADAPILAHASSAPFFLGMAGEVPWFAADVSAWEPDGQEAAPEAGFLDRTEQHFPGMDPDLRFAELRNVMTRLSPAEAELAATARGLFAWHGTHGFCARCGAQTVPSEGGWQRHCPSCGAPHFPRTDPVVIMLITHGNSVLLGRAPTWPEGMYSLLAGFVEPGETVEAAVRREVFEEAGVRVGRVSYLASQPWPFPASLMLGCQGEALTREITVDPTEIETALWVTREEMLSAFAGEHPFLKAARGGAIARFILSHWLADRLG